MCSCLQVPDILEWTNTVLNTSKIRGCTEKELTAVLHKRDTEEVAMLSTQDGAELLYVM